MLVQMTDTENNVEFPVPTQVQKWNSLYRELFFQQARRNKYAPPPVTFSTLCFHYTDSFPLPF